MWAYRIFILVWGVLPVVLVLLALRPVSPRELNRFSVRYGVDASPETTPAMKRYIGRGRRGRLIGAAMGLSLYPILYAAGLSIPNQSVFYGVLGYLLGAFATALLPTARGTEGRSASLLPRRLTDYLPRTALVAPAVAVGIGAVAVIVYEIEPRRALPQTSGTTLGLVVSAIAALATYVAIRIVVARPQPIISPHLQAVDDAMRTQTLHTLGGAGMAIAFLGAGSCLFEMGGYASAAWLTAIGLFTGVVTLGAAFSAWLFIGSAWRVRRASLPC
jgi:hypothetical protein